MNFPGAITMSGASVTTGAGTVTGSTVDGSVVTLNLTGITAPQVTMITLANVNDGATTSNVTIPMGVLVGDVNGDRAVNSGDTTVTRNNSGQVANVDNFRSDVNTDGTINSADATIVRNQSGQAITAPAGVRKQKVTTRY